jgi:hypothetical protein
VNREQPDITDLGNDVFQIDTRVAGYIFAAAVDAAGCVLAALRDAALRDAAADRLAMQ